MTRPPAFITSVDVRPSGGPHEYVTIYIRGQNVGTLCVGKGDAEPLSLLLLPGMKPLIEVSVEDLLARSSLGDPEAVRLRASAPPEAVDRVLARVDELEVRTATDEEQRQALERHPWPPGDRARIEEEERRSCERARPSWPWPDVVLRTATEEEQRQALERLHATFERAERAWPPLARVIGIDPAGADHRAYTAIIVDDPIKPVPVYESERAADLAMGVASIHRLNSLAAESEESGFVCSPTMQADARCDSAPICWECDGDLVPVPNAATELYTCPRCDR